MQFSMYQASVPSFVRGLKALDGVIDKAVADATARKIDPSVFLGYRLAPDMWALTRQIQIAGDFAKNCACRLAGVEPPKFEDTETSFPELKARIAKTLALLESYGPAQIDGSEDRDVTISIGGTPTTFKGSIYLTGFTLPNFYFHLTAAYAILRHAGVPLGKRDFMGV